MNFTKTRYRIITDKYNGYEVQAWRWWLPIWMQIGGRNSIDVNSSSSIKKARELIEEHKTGNKVVEIHNCDGSITKPNNPLN